MAEAIYLCDGKIPRCEKTSCYVSGGPCRHTTDLEHAVNFAKMDGGKAFFIEKEAGGR